MSDLQNKDPHRLFDSAWLFSGVFIQRWAAVWLTDGRTDTAAFTVAAVLPVETSGTCEAFTFWVDNTSLTHWLLSYWESPVNSSSHCDAFTLYLLKPSCETDRNCECFEDDDENNVNMYIGLYFRSDQKERHHDWVTTGLRPRPDEETSTTTDREELVWPDRLGARPLRGSPLQCRPASEDREGQDCWQGLSPLWLQQRWRLV